MPSPLASKAGPIALAAGLAFAAVDIARLDLEEIGGAGRAGVPTRQLALLLG
jgi:hypothetical protein